MPGTISPPNARRPTANVFEAVTKHVGALQSAGKRVVIALWSEGSRERMGHVLAEHKLVNLTPVASWPQALALSQASNRAGHSRRRKSVSRPPTSR